MAEYREQLLKKAQEAEEQTGNDGESVPIMTKMHGAKGLEFPVVYIPDANKGVTPRE